MLLSHDERSKICYRKAALLHFKLINGAKFDARSAVTSLELLRGSVASARLLVDNFFVDKIYFVVFLHFFFSYSCSFFDNFNCLRGLASFY